MSKNTLKRRQTTRQRTDGKTEDKDRKVIKKKTIKHQCYANDVQSD